MNDLLRTGLQIFLIYLVIFYVLKVMRGTRGATILRGVGILFLVLSVFAFFLIEYFQLDQIRYLLEGFLQISIFALVVIFAPELRAGLISLGKGKWFGGLKPRRQMLEELVKACMKLSRNRMGALIAIERDVGLGNYIAGGVPIDSEVKAELLETLFYPGAALHDGAVIIRNDRIAAAGCLFPLSDNPDISKSVGTRHRAGLGVTEESDAVVLVVSEESGRVSLALRGQLSQNLEKDGLERMLDGLFSED